MKRMVVALISAMVVGMMLAPPVSSGKSTVVTVPDRPGDLGKVNVYFNVGGANGVGLPNNTWGDNAPVLDAGYVDMISISFGVVRGTYVWGQELAGDLPQTGDQLPPGIKYAGWELWIESAPWSPTSGGVTLYIFWLEFDGTSYSVGMFDYSTFSITQLPSAAFWIDGAKFQVELSPELIGNLESFWWCTGTYLAKQNSWAPPWIVDVTDLDAGPGGVWFDLPWPPV